jgi:hypothetical protein
MNQPINIVLTWTLVRNVCAGFAAVVFFLVFLGTGAVWALEHHFDDRYVIVANTLKGELRKIDREIRQLEASGEDPATLEFLRQQREDILDDINNT